MAVYLPECFYNTMKRHKISPQEIIERTGLAKVTIYTVLSRNKTTSRMGFCWIKAAIVNAIKDVVREKKKQLAELEEDLARIEFEKVENQEEQ